MVLIKCKECNHQISSQAKTCPNCGYQIRKEAFGSTKSALGGCLKFVIIVPVVFILIAFLVGLFNKESEPVISQKLDITLPIYTQQAGNVGSMVCPTDILFEKHLGHGWQEIIDAKLSILNHKQKVADAGCDEVKGGIRVYIAPADLKKIVKLQSSNNVGLIFFGFEQKFTMGKQIFSSDLTNNPSGKYGEPYLAYKDIVDVASTNEKIKTASDKLSSVWFKQDFQYGADKIRVVFIKSQSIDESGKFDKDCHACGVNIAAVTYKQINNDWQLISKQKNIKIDGKFGDAPKIKQANIIRLTPNKVLFLITDSGLHQGYEDTSESLYLFSQNKWVDLGYIPSGGDYCFYVDEGHATKCYKFVGKISVIPSEKEYPDLLVTKTGTELDEKQNIIKAKNSVYIFKDGKYTEQVEADTEIAAHQAIKYKTQARDQAKADGTSAKAESMAKKEKICGIKANTYLFAADGRDNGFTPKQALGHMVQAKDEQDWKMKIDDFEHSGVPLAWMKEAINQVYFDPRFINARGNGFFMQMLNLCLFGSKRYEPLK